MNMKDVCAEDLEQKLELQNEVIDLYKHANDLYKDSIARQVAATHGLQEIVHFLVGKMKNDPFMWDEVEAEFNRLSAKMLNPTDTQFEIGLEP